MKKILYYILNGLAIVLFLSLTLLTVYSLASGAGVASHCLVGAIFLIISLSLILRYYHIVALSNSIAEIDPETSSSTDLARNWSRMYEMEIVLLIFVCMVGAMAFTGVYHRIFIEQVTLFD